VRFSMVDLPLFEVQSKIVGLGVLLLYGACVGACVECDGRQYIIF
jgi:hypothetical protein